MRLESITVEPKGDRWMAYLNGDRRRWDVGRSPDEAIGAAIRTHAHALGVVVAFPADPTPPPAAPGAS